MKRDIPEAPAQEVIEEQNTQRISDWLTYFEVLSPRIKVLTPDNPLFESTLLNLKEEAIKKTQIDPDLGQELCDWPKAEHVVFLVLFNSTMPNREAKFEPQDARIFSFNNFAFGPDYFEWDGDEDNFNCLTYSLTNYSEDVLSWHYITKLIKDRLSEFDTLVPPLE
jgi:hypothetical protein